MGSLKLRSYAFASEAPIRKSLYTPTSKRVGKHDPSGIGTVSHSWPVELKK